jgi:hypothetical protein
MNNFQGAIKQVAGSALAEKFAVSESNNTGNPVHSQPPEKCRCQQSDEELMNRARAVVEYERSVDKRLHGVSRVIAGQLQKRYGYTVRHIRRMRTMMFTRSLRRKLREGGPIVVERRRLMTQWLHEALKITQGDVTVRSLAAKMRSVLGIGGIGTVHRLLRHNGYRRVRRRLLPLLTAEHKMERISWAQRLLSEEERRDGESCRAVIVHLDEKWFFEKNLSLKVWSRPGNPSHPIYILNKRHLRKVMFLGALAAPVEQYHFDGKIGLFPVVEQVTAKKNSKHRKAGTSHPKPLEMNRDLFVKMMCEQLIPAALRKTCFCRVNNIPDGLGWRSRWRSNISLHKDNSDAGGMGRKSDKKSEERPLGIKAQISTPALHLSATKVSRFERARFGCMELSPTCSWRSQSREKMGGRNLQQCFLCMDIMVQRSELYWGSLRHAPLHCALNR